MSVYHTTYTFHLHTPSSYLLSRFSPVATVNVLHHTTPLLLHYTFVLQWGITVYICIPYHLHIPPSHSLLLSPLQVLTCGHGQRTTSHITPHHCYHYTFGLQWGIIVYVCIHILPSHSLLLSHLQVLTCGPGDRTGHGREDNVPRMTPVQKMTHVAVQQVTGMTYTDVIQIPGE